MCLAENCRHIESAREPLWMFCIWHFLKNQHWELFSSSPCIVGITGTHVSRGWVCFVHCSTYSFGRGWTPYKLDLDPLGLVRCRCIKSGLSWQSRCSVQRFTSPKKCMKNALKTIKYDRSWVAFLPLDSRVLSKQAFPLSFLGLLTEARPLLSLPFNGQWLHHLCCLRLQTSHPNLFHSYSLAQCCP